MIITFCGHRDSILSAEEERLLGEWLRQYLEECPNATFYLGDYGNFDKKCNAILRKLQKYYSKIKRVFVTPYLSPDYGHLKTAKEDYDEILYPFEDRVMPRYAIRIRNEWMVDRADVIVACVNRNWGGAYATYAYAMRRGKPIRNIRAI